MTQTSGAGQGLSRVVVRVEGPRRDHGGDLPEKFET